MGNSFFPLSPLFGTRTRAHTHTCTHMVPFLTCNGWAVPLTHTHTHTHAHMLTHGTLFVLPQMRRPTHTHTHAHTRTHTHTHTHSHTHTHKHAHTHTHSHTHTPQRTHTCSHGHTQTGGNYMEGHLLRN